MIFLDMQVLSADAECLFPYKLNFCKGLSIPNRGGVKGEEGFASEKLTL